MSWIRNTGSEASFYISPGGGLIQRFDRLWLLLQGGPLLSPRGNLFQGRVLSSAGILLSTVIQCFIQQHLVYGIRYSLCIDPTVAYVI
jgi:hypothetical protein